LPSCPVGWDLSRDSGSLPRLESRDRPVLARSVARWRRGCHDAIVATASAETSLGRGYKALTTGYWCLANVAGLMRQLTEEVAATTV
jgi:hypothetical protein